MKRAFALSLLCAAALTFGGAVLVRAQAPDIGSYETEGILNDAGEGQLSANIWDGMTHAQAVSAVRALPDRYASAVLFELARRLLLSDAPAFKETESDGAGDLLVARIDKLLSMGALRDAEQLYTTATHGKPATMDVAMRGMTILMLRGQMPAACLDVETLQDKFADDTRLQDMHALCAVAQADTPVEKQAALKSARFQTFFVVPVFLRQGLKLPLYALNTETLGFAVGLGLVPPQRATELGPLSPRLPTLLLSVLREMGLVQTDANFTCTVNELAVRGVIDVNDLRALYDKAHFDGGYLKAGADRTKANACLRPVIAYQMLAAADADNTVAKVLPDALALLKGQPLPLQGPSAKLVSHGAPLEGAAALQAGLLAAAYTETLPQTKPDGAIVALEALYPKTENQKSGGDFSPTTPVGVFAEALSAEKPLRKLDKSTYGKILLTSSANKNIPEFVVWDSFARALDKKQAGIAVSTFLTGFGAASSDAMPPQLAAVAVSGFSKMGMTRLMRRYAVEILSHKNVQNLLDSIQIN